MNKYAYVTILYGTNIYITGACVLGFTLMKTNTKYDRVILITPDVSIEYENILKNFFTHIIQINYVEVNPTIFMKLDTRFRDVFTKLSCIDLIQYEKIILLDLDMVICKNIDHLFELRSPGACVKHHNIPYGSKVNPELICKENKLIGSINAGLMLLKPDRDEWNEINRDIKTNSNLYKFKYPEQDYISLRYCAKWTSITFNYNFQFGLTRRVRELGYKSNDIYVIHYSSSYKPWNELNPSHNSDNDERKFIKSHRKYYVLWKNIYINIKHKYKLTDY